MAIVKQTAFSWFPGQYPFSINTTINAWLSQSHSHCHFLTSSCLKLFLCTNSFCNSSVFSWKPLWFLWEKTINCQCFQLLHICNEWWNNSFESDNILFPFGSVLISVHLLCNLVLSINEQQDKSISSITRHALPLVFWAYYSDVLICSDWHVSWHQVQHWKRRSSYMEHSPLFDKWPDYFRENHRSKHCNYLA